MSLTLFVLECRSLSDKLCVFIPTRHRRVLAEKCVESFRATSEEGTGLFLVVDDDDEDYEDVDVPVIVAPRGTLVTAINHAALWLAGEYSALMLAGDDQVFITPGWDRFMLKSLDVLGGSGWVFPDDKRRYDVPEHPLITSDVVEHLGWFAEPGFGHFFIDNVWAELGKRAELIRYCQDAVVEHRHYSTHADVERDLVYREAEDQFGSADFEEFQRWQAERMTGQVAGLRRRFNKDLDWVLNKV